MTYQEQQLSSRHHRGQHPLNSAHEPRDRRGAKKSFRGALLLLPLPCDEGGLDMAGAWDAPLPFCTEKKAPMPCFRGCCAFALEPPPLHKGQTWHPPWTYPSTHCPQPVIYTCPI